MSQKGLVQRLIAFLKKPDALSYDHEQPVYNPYDDYVPRGVPHHVAPEHLPKPDVSGPYNQTLTGSLEDPYAISTTTVPDMPIVNMNSRSPNHASRLDALVWRAVQQFNGEQGYVIRSDPRGERMYYCTGRDSHGGYVAYDKVNPDRRAVNRALDSGESQLFSLPDQDENLVILCGPLRVDDEVVGVLYLCNPSHSRLHRGMFDLFCDQVARMLHDGIV
ncbi:MAG: GAF domain-containing protein [Anaerolineae bacterium]|nr:GAF domain-containing protein [Anaerolineae bacterium]